MIFLLPNVRLAASSETWEKNISQVSVEAARRNIRQKKTYFIDEKLNSIGMFNDLSYFFSLAGRELTDSDLKELRSVAQPEFEPRASHASFLSPQSLWNRGFSSWPGNLCCLNFPSPSLQRTHVQMLLCIILCEWFWKMHAWLCSTQLHFLAITVRLPDSRHILVSCQQTS